MKQEIYDTVKSVIDSLGLSIYHIEFNMNVLKVLIEAKDGPVTVEACANAARLLSAKLDAVDLIPHRYHLEISSPGIERGLFRPEHYKLFRGHTCRLVTSQGAFVGKIADADEEMVKIESIDGANLRSGSNLDGESTFVTFPYAEIKSGKLKVSDDNLFGRERVTDNLVEKAQVRRDNEQGN